MKTFVLTVSRTFPKTHKRAGQQTWFVEKINEAVMPISDDPIMGKIKGEVIDYFQSENLLKEINKHHKAVLFEGNLVYLK